MPRVVTDVHDSLALAALCDLLDLPPPVERSLWLNGEEVFGWVVRLKGLRYPVVCDTLTGLIAYHPQDNAFDRYAHLMRLIERYYDLRPKLQRDHHRHVPGKPPNCKRQASA
jgi:hypothetical protein